MVFLIFMEKHNKSNKILSKPQCCFFLNYDYCNNFLFFELFHCKSRLQMPGPWTYMHLSPNSQIDHLYSLVVVHLFLRSWIDLPGCNSIFYVNVRFIYSGWPFRRALKKKMLIYKQQLQMNIVIDFYVEIEIIVLAYINFICFIMK